MNSQTKPIQKAYDSKIMHKNYWFIIKNIRIFSNSQD